MSMRYVRSGLVAQTPTQRTAAGGADSVAVARDGPRPNDTITLRFPGHPDRKVTVTRELLHQNVDHTPYEGFSVTGWPAVTISRGEVVFENGQVVGRPGRGRFVKRKATTGV